MRTRDGELAAAVRQAYRYAQGNVDIVDRQLYHHDDGTGHLVAPPVLSDAHRKDLEELRRIRLAVLNALYPLNQLAEKVEVRR
jgi:hypothetical protein